MNLKIDDELRDLIPPLSDDEYAGLEADIISTQRVRVPIDVWGETIVDGHNRYEIATKHGIAFDVNRLEFADKREVRVWIRRNQLHRRNLSDGWKAELALANKAEYGEQGREKQKRTLKQYANNTVLSENDKTDTHNSQAKIAEDLGWSTGKVAQAEWTRQNAPEVWEKAKTGELSVHGAYKRAKRVDDNKEKIESQFQSKATEESEISDVLAVPSRDAHMFRVSSEPSPNRLGVGDWIVSLQDETINTVTRLSRFFHRESNREFSLREYADVQTFPSDYKFIGTDSQIKSQIGNAVAPAMAEYISQHVEGASCGDLFAGCGGFSCGLEKYGVEVKWAVEWETHAAQSFKLNNESARVVNTNIKSLDPNMFERVDIIIGGPPCQGFSSANTDNSGTRDFKSDPRNELYKEFLRFVETLRPREFIMENVAQIMDVKDEIVSDFEAVGYSVEIELVYGPDIGMQQTRKRCFFVGILK